jgi:hypothetical protein
VQSVDHWRLAAHRDGLFDVAYRELRIGLNGAAHFDSDILALDTGKALQGERDGVLTDRQVLELIQTLGIGHVNGRPPDARWANGFDCHTD